jgi:hypothetical protein
MRMNIALMQDKARCPQLSGQSARGGPYIVAHGLDKISPGIDIRLQLVTQEWTSFFAIATSPCHAEMSEYLRFATSQSAQTQTKHLSRRTLVIDG